MDDPWEISYVRRVLASTGLAPSALAKRGGFASSTLTRALNDPDHKFRLSTTTLDRIRDATGIDYSAEKGGEPEAETGDELVPVYDVEASAGHGSFVDHEDHRCHLGFARSFLREMTVARTQDLAIIRVKGHSMEPTLLDDDHVLVDLTKTNLSWDGMFVIRFDDALHVKRVGRSAKKGNVMVISDHPSYPVLDMAAADLAVVGRVLWVGRKV